MQKHNVVGLLLYAALILTGCAVETGIVATASVVEASAACLLYTSDAADE